MIYVRRSLWETNSSSVHQFTIDYDKSIDSDFFKNDIHVPKEIELKYIVFGWEYEDYYTIDEKVTYILACLDDLPSDSPYLKYHKILLDFLSNNGVTIKNLDTFKFGYGKTWKDPDCLVDHSYDHLMNLIPILDDQESLYRFLFLDTSFISTGNDNDGPFSDDD